MLGSAVNLRIENRVACHPYVARYEFRYTKWRIRLYLSVSRMKVGAYVCSAADMVPKR